MRHVSKRTHCPHELLRQRHQERAQPTSGGEARSAWSSFGYKAEVMALLTREQYGLCCYSEVRPDERGLGSHIEHVQPKSLYPLRTFDYHNLMMCAFDDQALGQTATLSRGDTFGGHAKEDDYDPARFISPLDADCARYFTYLSDGQIVPATTLGAHDLARVRYKIEVLNLNCGALQTWRRAVLEELERSLDDYAGAEEDTLDCFLRRAGDQLQEFFSAVRQAGGPIAEQVLRERAPGLA